MERPTNTPFINIKICDYFDYCNYVVIRNVIERLS